MNTVGSTGTVASTSAAATPGVQAGSGRIAFALFVFLAALALCLDVTSLARYPAAHTDEAWYANLASNWIATGNARTTLDAGPYPDGLGAGTTLLGALPMRLGIQLWGLSLWAVRLPGLVAGLLLLAAVAAVGLRLWAGAAGPIAALTLALLPIFVQASHMARPEIWVALLAVLALGCAVMGWQRGQPLWDVLAGLLAVTAPQVHQNGAVFALGLAAGYVALYGRSVLRRPGSLAFFAISLLGGGFYVYPMVAAGGGGTLVSGTGSHAIPLLTSGPFILLLTEFWRYLSYLGTQSLPALLFGLGLALALRRRAPADRLLLGWLAGSVAAMALLVSRVYDLYLIPLVAVASLPAGRLLADWLKSRDAGRRAVSLLALAVLALPLAETLLSSGNTVPDASRVESELRQAVPCARIVGPNEYWFSFTQCDYRSFDLVDHYHFMRGFSLEEGMAAVRPDYLIINKSIEDKLRDGFGEGGSMFYYVLPQAELERFLDEHTTLVRLISVPNAGAIQVRRVNWEVSYDATADARQ